MNDRPLISVICNPESGEYFCVRVDMDGLLFHFLLPYYDALSVSKDFAGPFAIELPSIDQLSTALADGPARREWLRGATHLPMFE